MPERTFRIGTRSSKLALQQTEMVIKSFRTHFGDAFNFSIIPLITEGDAQHNASLQSFSIESAFASLLQEYLIDSRIDLAAHSAKDIPTKCPDSLVIPGYLSRDDPRDVMILSKKHFNLLPVYSLKDLPSGFIIGTSSVRRDNFIAQWIPTLKTAPIRGNIHTRLQKLDSAMFNFDALILAAAALIRIDLSHRISCYLDEFLHSPGQGAIAIQCRKLDFEIIDAINAINHESTFLCVEAERNLLSWLNGGCSLPLAVKAEILGNRNFRMKALLVSENRVIECETKEDISRTKDAVETLFHAIRAQQKLCLG